MAISALCAKAILRKGKARYAGPKSSAKRGTIIGEARNRYRSCAQYAGYVPIDVEGSRLLYQVISKCHEKRSVIITTNMEFGKWGAVLGDDKMAAALVDRLVYHGRMVEFTGASHRMENALMLGKQSEEDAR